MPLKCILASIIALVLKLSFVNAQTLLPRAGVAITRGTESHAVAGTTFTFGFGVEFDNGKTKVLTECNYLVRDHSFYNDTTTPQGGTNYEASTKHNYIDIPLLVKRYFGKGKFEFFIDGGLYFDYGLGGTKRGTLTFHYPGADLELPMNGRIIYSSDTPDWDVANAYYMNRVDIGLLAGGGVLIHKALIVDIRYGFGLFEMQPDLHNSTLQISLSVPMKLARL